MYRYQRLLTLLLILFITISISTPLVLQYSSEWLKKMRASNILSDKSSHSLVYQLNKEKWLDFNIQNGSDKLRIISNAEVGPLTPYITETNWIYEFHYQLLDNDGNILEDTHYQQRTSLTPYKDENNQIFYANSYSDSTNYVLDGRLFILNLLGIKNATRIRIKLGYNDPYITGVSMRLYEPTKVAEHRLATNWLRLSPEEKIKIAKGSVYNAELLSEYEKINLLRNQWKPIGPQGIEGQNYTVNALYSIREIGDDELIKQAILPAGSYVDVERPAVIAIPEYGGKLELQFKSIDGSALPESHLNLSWFGDSRELRWGKEALLNSDISSLTYQIDGGKLKINSSQALIINAYLHLEEGQRIDITPIPLVKKGYLLDPDIDYTILHSDSSPTVIKLDLRRYFQLDDLPSKPKVSYQCFNLHNEQLCQGELSVAEIPSEYDRLKEVLEPERISDSTSHYLTFPAAVSRLKISATQPSILINAYNQPWGISKKNSIPEDSYISLERAFWQPSWFALQPNNVRELNKQRKNIWIYGQYRPPEESIDLLSGDYSWQDFVPKNNYTSRFIMTDYSKNSIRSEALASSYCLLPINKNVVINFNETSNRQITAPELIFNRAQKGMSEVDVILDGQSILKTELFGKQGQLILPAIKIGKHTLRILSADGQWWINHSQSCAGKQVLKRRVFSLQSTLQFNYQHKKEDELLSGRFYIPIKQSERSQFKVTIKPLFKTRSNIISHTQNWTFKQRQYDIRASQEGHSMVLSAGGLYLNAGEQFFVPIQSDLDAGMYQVEVKHISGPKGYVALSQVTAGEYEIRRFYRELVLNDR